MNKETKPLKNGKKEKMLEYTCVKLNEINYFTKEKDLRWMEESKKVLISEKLQTWFSMAIFNASDFDRNFKKKKKKI